MEGPYSTAGRHRAVVREIARALGALLAPVATTAEDGSRLVLVVGNARDAVYLGQSISDSISDGETFEEAVSVCTLQTLQDIQDMIVREMKTPWPSENSSSDMLLPDVAVDNGVLWMWFGDRATASLVTSVDLRGLDSQGPGEFS